MFALLRENMRASAEMLASTKLRMVSREETTFCDKDCESKAQGWSKGYDTRTGGKIYTDPMIYENLRPATSSWMTSPQP
eukprot:CAMPEP_0173384772 /NCGR_PEP_ID=MMETSP1356-20130122/7359_1 /TAXON_ID=77927 ORGANISM="Hemiselmis virescens, Strain PCC157" /NCGR_SAMPLE_ID=MMETSP1356 /ASSEMBLY_ACC=CAM_ASM_000847 /LENGTH=78 /DNA_ID=CAMNT_0014340301 /DNA_START=95 /DNA_END=331 /DNA_ORIENTATION=-